MKILITYEQIVCPIMIQTLRVFMRKLYVLQWYRGYEYLWAKYMSYNDIEVMSIYEQSICPTMI